MAAHSFKYYSRLHLFHHHLPAPFIVEPFAAKQELIRLLHRNPGFWRQKQAPELHLSVPAVCVRAKQKAIKVSQSSAKQTSKQTGLKMHIEETKLPRAACS